MDRIETGRLILRPPARRDLADFLAYCANPEVGPNAGWEPICTRWQARWALRELIRGRESWALEEKEQGNMIGTVALHLDKRRNYSGAREIGFSLNPGYWGKGYMTEAALALISYGFSVMNLLILCADHYPFNLRSKRVIEKCGFHYEGTLRMACKMYSGNIYDHACYSLTRQEWLARQEAGLPEAAQPAGLSAV